MINNDEVLKTVLSYKNPFTNILCFNPLEQNFDKIKPLDIKDLVKITINDDIRNELREYEINGIPLFTFGEIGNKTITVVNPRAFKNTKQRKSLKAIKPLFN